MKKQILSLAVVMCCLIPGVNAQNRGDWWVGGSVGVDYSKVKNGNELTNYNILPEAGYAFSDRWAVGMSLGYVHDESMLGADKVKRDGFTVNPFARFSFLHGRIGNLFLDGGAGYTYIDNKYTDNETNRFEVGIRPGVVVNVSDRVSLLGKFGFIGYEYDKTGSVKTNHFAANFDLNQILLGINFRF